MTKSKRHGAVYVSLKDFLQHGATSRAELAEALRISRSYLSMLESGQRQPALGLALRIEELTGVPASALVQNRGVAA